MRSLGAFAVTLFVALSVAAAAVLLAWGLLFYSCSSGGDC